MNQFPFHPDPACTEVQDSLEAFLDNELEADAHAKVAAHVAACATCRAELRFVQAISGALHELPKPAPPPKIFNTVAAYVRVHPNQGPQWLNPIRDLFTFSKSLTSRLVRAGALVCLVGIALFGGHQYQQHLRVKQAARDLYYAFSQLNYAVARTGTVVHEKLPAVQIGAVSSRPFIQIETASRHASKQTQHISSAIHRSLNSLDRSPQNAPDTKNHQRSP